MIWFYILYILRVIFTRFIPVQSNKWYHEYIILFHGNP